MFGTLSRITFSCIVWVRGDGDERMAASEKIATRDQICIHWQNYATSAPTRHVLDCIARVLHPTCCEVCGLTTQCSHNDDDRYQRGNIDQLMRLTACIPDIDQSSPHHKLPGGCISANGGLFTESEKSVLNVSFQSRPLTIIDFGMMNGLVTLISVACSRLVRRYGR